MNHCSNNTNKLSPQEHNPLAINSRRVQIIQINLALKNDMNSWLRYVIGSNNTNKLSPQERYHPFKSCYMCSNNTNKLSPQELYEVENDKGKSSNNTNKLSPQEPVGLIIAYLCFIYSISGV